jgi:hypothetical protein
MMASSSAELEVRSSASDSSLSEWHLDTGSSARCWGTGGPAAYSMEWRLRPCT